MPDRDEKTQVHDPDPSDEAVCLYCLGDRLVDDGSTVECLDCGVTL